MKRFMNKKVLAIGLAAGTDPRRSWSCVRVLHHQLVQVRARLGRDSNQLRSSLSSHDSAVLVPWWRCQAVTFTVDNSTNTEPGRTAIYVRVSSTVAAHVADAHAGWG